MRHYSRGRQAAKDRGGGETMSDRAKIMKWFRADHLPEGMAKVTSKMIGDLARDLDSLLPDNDQADQALMGLLTAKDCAVRAVLDQDVSTYG